MKRILIFILIMIAVVALWYSSVIFMFDNFGAPADVAAVNDMFGGINSLFSALALAIALYAVTLLVIDVKIVQENLDKTMQSNKISLEVIALSALIDECDTTLLRYDRWEEAGIKGDYANAKATVRDKMNSHRDTLERKLDEIRAS